MRTATVLLNVVVDVSDCILNYIYIIFMSILCYAQRKSSTYR